MIYHLKKPPFVTTVPLLMVCRKIPARFKLLVKHFVASMSIYMYIKLLFTISHQHVLPRLWQGVH